MANQTHLLRQLHGSGSDQDATPRADNVVCGRPGALQTTGARTDSLAQSLPSWLTWDPIQLMHRQIPFRAKTPHQQRWQISNVCRTSAYVDSVLRNEGSATNRPTDGSRKPTSNGFRIWRSRRHGRTCSSIRRRTEGCKQSGKTLRDAGSISITRVTRALRSCGSFDE